MSKTFIAVIGEEKKEFTLYTDIATRSSKFFEAALSKSWQESVQNCVTLKDFKVVEFESYLRWLSTCDRSFLVDFDLCDIAGLYILGDFLDDSAFRMNMLRRFASRSIDQNVYPNVETVTLTWEQTPENSPLRKMSVEMWITSSIEELAKEFARPDQDFPKAFIVDCLHRIGQTTKPRAKETLVGEKRKQALESRRDELLKELV